MKFTYTLIAFFILNLNIYAQEETKIAFLADVHLQDLYGSFTDSNYKGIRNPKNGKYVLMRTMASQLHSTRIFNENYFAFITALDDIAGKGIKIVALPGDYTDDGQPIHLRGLKQILNKYTEDYGIQFFITTGNHDPVAPWDKPAGKYDFLGKRGKQQPIFSDISLNKSIQSNSLPAVITKDIANMGYEGITEYLKEFGYFPNPNLLYWATPFSTYKYSDYKYKTALTESGYNTRNYSINNNINIPDASYVAEPVKGVWLLALDGNVYIPKNLSYGDAKESLNFSGTSVGYNNVISNKAHLLEWVKTVVTEAERLGKTLIAFSHYPMVEYNDGASEDIEALLGKGKWQMERVPTENVADFFANAGIKIHFAGHMHINDTGVYKTKNGKTLINVQTPSLAAYIPAYKILTIHKNSKVSIETVTINNVPRYNELFYLYKKEYRHLKKSGSTELWNKEILNTKNYHDFMLFHLRELVRLRFIPNEWPQPFTDDFTTMDGYEILTKTNKEKSSINLLLKQHGISATELRQWNGADWIYDLYKFQSADCLALPDIDKKKMMQYNMIMDAALKNHIKPEVKEIEPYLLFFRVFKKLSNGELSGNFEIDLETGIIKTQ